MTDYVSVRSLKMSLSIPFIDRNDDVIIVEYVVSPGPAFHRIVVDGFPRLDVLGKSTKEMRGEEVDTIFWNLEFVV